jgi:glycogen debranching enzyme
LSIGVLKIGVVQTTIVRNFSRIAARNRQQVCMNLTRALSIAETETVQETPFYIPATGIGSRRRHSLKYNDTFLVIDSHGDIGAAEGGPDGLFHNDTRFLSRLELTVNDLPPLLLGSNIRDDNTVLTVDLTNPDIFHGEQMTLHKDTLHIVRTVFLWRGAAYQRIGVRNHGSRPAAIRLRLRFDSDFADLFEVRGLKRERRGVVRRDLTPPDRLVLTYQGLDATTRRMALTFDPPPTRLEEGEALYQSVLEPGELMRVFLSMDCDSVERRKMTFAQALIYAHRERRATTCGMATVETSNELFNEVLCRSAADLSMLMTDTPQGRYPYAGIPWYSTTFGRDGLITALQMLWFEPSAAHGVLRRLAAFQAKVDDPAADAQPGKILHEMRAGEMAALGEVPFGLYYGSVDSTPLFVLLAGAYTQRTGDMKTIAELWPAVEAALGWIDGPGDPDGDGFVEYRRATAQGLANQGWKDSFDAVFRADGSLVEGDVALAEVQGYVFAAKRAAAVCARRLGLVERAEQLETQAADLAARFETAFWCPEIGSYALALDGDKKPCRVLTSNAGQVLFSGIASAERAAAVAAGLLGPRFFSGWGIRTVATGEARYNPMSYHNGSIWPHDNALIALGFARYGLKSAVTRLFSGLVDAATYMELRRLPELFCGFQRQRGRGPTLYPVACAPQAWASATPFSLLEASIGLEFDPRSNEIRLRNPRLPPFLDEVLLRNLRLGDASINLRIRRFKEEVALDIPKSSGKIQVSVVLSS